jgi:hypothetical protein
MTHLANISFWKMTVSHEVSLHTLLSLHLEGTYSLICLFYNAVGDMDCMMSSGRMIGKWWIEKDLEGNGYGLIKVLSLCLEEMWQTTNVLQTA